MTNNAVTSGHGPVTPKPLYVFEAPVRIWHWTHALSIAVLCVTGYFIAYPLPAVGGEASDHFIMGNMRMIHFIAAYVFAIGFAVRIYWAFVGNKYSRELFILPLWRGSWWREFFEEVKFYLFLRRTPPVTIAHNPLAQTAMWLFNFILALFLIFTGFALYGEGLGAGSWADRGFGWIIPMLGDSLNVKMWHLTGMWLLIVFIIIHIYMAIRADIMSRQSSISTIFGGWRFFR